MSKQINRVENTNGHTAEEGLPLSTPVGIGDGTVTINIGMLKAMAFHYRWQIAGAMIALAFLYYMTRPATPAGWPVAGNYAAGGFNQAGFIATPTVKVPVSQRPTAGLTFVVAKVGRAGSSVFLNSSGDYKSPGNQTICLQGEAASALGGTAEGLVGRTVTATGAASGDKYGNPQIIVRSASQLLVR